MKKSTHKKKYPHSSFHKVEKMLVKKFGDDEFLDIVPPGVPNGPTLWGKNLRLDVQTSMSFQHAFTTLSTIGESLIATLKVINQQASKMVIFGSSTLECFIPFKDTHGDIDLLIYGVTTPEDVLSTANGFVEYFSQFGKTMQTVKPGLMQLIVYDPEDKEVKIQIGLRHFKSLSQAASEIDFALTAVFFDGTNVFFTDETRRQLMTQRIDVDPRRFSHASIDRLAKYHARGFDVTFPDLHIDAFQTGEPIVLCDGALKITYSKTCGLFVVGQVHKLGQNDIEYGAMPPHWKIAHFNMCHMGKNVAVRPMEYELCVDFEQLKTFGDALPEDVFKLQKLKFVRKALPSTNGQLLLNFSILDKVFSFDPDMILKVAKMCMENRTEALMYLHKTLEAKYEKIRNVKIDFIRRESLLSGFDSDTFYGKYNIRQGKVPLLLQIDTLTGLVHNMFGQNSIQTCGICQLNIDNHEKNVLTMSCGHKHHFSMFHKCQGLETWFTEHRNCPMCRSSQ